MASTLENPVWAEWLNHLMGGGSRENYAATLPPDRYFCLLDELPMHLIPRPALRALYEGDYGNDNRQPLVRNPDCVIYSDGQFPQAFDARPDLLAGFDLRGAIAWVRNRERGTLLPFWLGPQLADVVNLNAGEPVSSSLPKDLRVLLAAAGIVISDRECKLAQERRLMTSRSATLFQQRGYAPLGGLIHPFHVAALRRYYRYLIRTGAIRLGDRQSPRRHVAYDEPVARFFHHQIAATLSTLAGEPLKPSYVYLASYLSGAELRKHTDREQCEFSITLCLDFSPEPALETPWPIQLDTPTGTITVYQALGDGLAYRGTRLPHYRSRLGEGQTSTSIFFHYVSADFSGSLH